MKHLGKFCLRLSLCLYALAFTVIPALAQQAAPNPSQAGQKEIIRKARQSYYNLRDEGLASFQCSITPNWELLLEKERSQNPEGVDAAIKTLSQLHFTVDLAADNSVKLTHNELSGQNEQMMSALRQIYGGMEQMTSGFFDTWKLFALSPPLPELSSQYVVEPVGALYRLSYREDNADVVTKMSRNFAITDMKITTSEFDSSIQPSFTSTPKGLLLSGYEANYSSQKPEEATRLKVTMDYQLVNGLLMLHKLDLSGSYGGSPFAIQLTFSDCVVTKR